MKRTLVVLAGVVLLLIPQFPAPSVLAQQRAFVSTGFVAAGGADFGAMKSAGASAVKLVADWSELEPQRGKFAWGNLDQAVTAARRAGLRVVLVLSYTPKWASIATGVELNDPAIYSRQPPKRLADWDAFVTAAVARYRSQVKDWQVWTALSLPIFRGTARDYIDLLKVARAKTKAGDPSSRIVMATSLGIDLVSIRRAFLEARSAFDAVSLAPRGLAPEALLRPLGALRDRLFALTPKKVWLEWDPRSVGERPSWPSQALKVMAIAKAFGVEQVFWVMDGPAGIAPALQAADQIGGRPFAGYLTAERALAFVFADGTSAAAVAWSTSGEASFKVDGDSVKVVALSGDARSISAESGKASVAVGAEPVVVIGLGAASVADARGVLQSRGLPVPPSAQDFSQATEVSARLGRTNAEHGLYNMPYRSRRNGAVEPVEVGGSESVRTNASKEIVFIYFDVDDSFLYYVDGRAAVEISVEVHGASAPQQLGFNIFYDSMTGYRFTSWQVVEAKDGWVTYTFRLNDAGFSNTWGWDFAINAVGNRKEDLTVRSVTVRKASR